MKKPNKYLKHLKRFPPRIQNLIIKFIAVIDLKESEAANWWRIDVRTIKSLTGGDKFPNKDKLIKNKYEQRKFLLNSFYGAIGR